MQRADWAMAAVAATLLVPGVVGGAHAAARWSDAAAYAAAEPCPSDVPVAGPRTRECFHDVRGRVLSTSQGLQPGDTYLVYYDLPSVPLSEEVSRGLVKVLDADEQVARTLVIGAGLRLRVWDGTVTQVSSAVGTHVTDDAPAARAADITFEAVMWAFAGLALLALVAGRHRGAALLGVPAGVAAAVAWAQEERTFTEGATPLALFLVGVLGALWLLEFSRTGSAASRPTPSAARPAAR
ncbi:MAG TPA: hypothetical protein VNA20_17310 [Frankiaceae bacterium]|nr:hypothetical protein [Frankiaceae bacterium]